MRRFLLFAAALTSVLGCRDTSADCAYYKDAGYCETYKDTLKEMCGKTCGFCGVGPGLYGGGEGADPGIAVDPRPAREPEKPELCRDTCSTKDCQWYNQQGHCKEYSAVMMMNCASTCGWCGARLCSPPEVENGWTDFEMTMVPAGASINVFCYDGFKNMGSAQLSCSAYGEIDGQARCEEVGGEEGAVGLSQETGCQRAANAAVDPSYANGQYVVPQASTHYVPQCDDYNGNYKEIQYDGSKGETFCVDVYRGSEVQGTRIQGKHEYVSCTPSSAKEYYDRLAEERAYESGSSSDYNLDDYRYGNDGEEEDPYYYKEKGAGEAAGNKGDYYNYDTTGDYSGDDGYYASGDDGYYASGDDGYYASGDDGYYAESGEEYEVAGGEDYYNYDTSTGGGYYAAEGGDDYYDGGGFDGTYYYAEGDEAEELSESEVLYSATADDGSVGGGGYVADDSPVLERVVEEEEEESAVLENSKDVEEKRRWRNRRNKRDAELESTQE